MIVVGMGKIPFSYIYLHIDQGPLISPKSSPGVHLSFLSTSRLLSISCMSRTSTGHRGYFYWTQRIPKFQGVYLAEGQREEIH